MHFNFFMPPQLIFGRGKLDELSTITLPGKKALIVITNGKSMIRLGYADRVISLLQQNSCSSVIFDKAQPNPNLTQVMEAAELARNENCDFIIGLGGGSAIDTAKAVAVMTKNNGNFWNYVKDGKEVTEAVLPIIAIPTTAGTGTEADPWTVITNTETNEKISFGHSVTYPKISIIDPELMLSVPSKLTAYQGMDIFFHSVEGFLSNVAKPISDIFALEAIRRITQFLPQAVSDGNNLQAREEMAYASVQTGIAESVSGCISEHSMERALSAFYPELPNGAGLVALSVPYFNHLLQKGKEKVGERYVLMARAMGEEGNSPELFITALRKLISAVGLDNLNLSDWGIQKEEAEKLAANSFDAMGFLYALDPVTLNMKDATCVIRDSIH